MVSEAAPVLRRKGRRKLFDLNFLRRFLSLQRFIEMLQNLSKCLLQRATTKATAKETAEFGLWLNAQDAIDARHQTAHLAPGDLRRLNWPLPNWPLPNWPLPAAVQHQVKAYTDHKATQTAASACFARTMLEAHRRGGWCVYSSNVPGLGASTFKTQLHSLSAFLTESPEAYHVKISSKGLRLWRGKWMKWSPRRTVHNTNSSQLGIHNLGSQLADFTGTCARKLASPSAEVAWEETATACELWRVDLLLLAEQLLPVAMSFLFFGQQDLAGMNDI